jgi:hypothetical protein
MKKLLDLVGQSAACNGLLCAGSEGPIVFAPYKPTYATNRHVTPLRVLCCVPEGKDNFPCCEVLTALHEIIMLIVIDECSSPMVVEVQPSEARCPHRRRPRANAQPDRRG